MNKCQEAVKELKSFVHSELDGTRMLDEYLKYCDILQELVDKETPIEEIEEFVGKAYSHCFAAHIIGTCPYHNQNIPTIEEVKKEWEEEGFEIISCSKEKFEVYKQWIERHQKVSHHTSAKIVIEKDFFYIVGQFSNKYTQLLTKTFRALGWFDDENR